MAEHEHPLARSSVERLRLLPMYALPHHLLSGMMMAATRIRLAAWKNWQIRWFVRRYGVDMSIAQVPTLDAYEEFNSFFTRALRPEARPVCELARSLVSPCDGHISQFGTVRHDALLQAKGQSYSLSRLLGGDDRLANEFEGGAYATIYLSPRDYHRVHMPLAGRLRRTVHVPGRLFSVNPRSVRSVPGLFARNERVVSIWDTDMGPLAMVLVGAVFVGSIEQVWCGALPPASRGAPRVTDYGNGAVTLDKGEEMGRFNMGSTVILALGNPSLRWLDALAPGRAVRMGERLAEVAEDG
jgi:phosphatidylserine decarboxylase